MVNKLPANAAMWVRALGQEDPLEKEMATHSMDRGTWRATVHGVAKSQKRSSDFHFQERYKEFHQNNDII